MEPNTSLKELLEKQFGKFQCPEDLASKDPLDRERWIARVRKGLPPNIAARRAGVSRCTLYRWCHEAGIAVKASKVRAAMSRGR